MNKPVKMEPGVKLRDAAKMALIPVKVLPTEKNEMLRKPEWLKIRLPKSTERIEGIKQAMRKHGLHSVCEEASCPNLSECFNHGTATFMILGAICTRRCPFCDVAHGRPLTPDATEPEKLALTIKDMKLSYVVITSVDRDDLRDGGAQHFADCIREIRKHSPNITIEILVPDFRGRMDRALEILIETPPDVFNHNLETAPRLYKLARPGADYKWSLELLRRFKEAHPEIKTKSGLMVGLGEEISEIEEVLRDLRAHNVDMLTVGQYLQPSKHHLPVKRYVPPAEFDALKAYADEIGFTHAASGPFVRSSYHADQQAAGKEVK
ncbi:MULTISPECIES: lipoyl synthase [Pseudoalteromonas]|jgi:lipoic acid synthetase|uniref:Lipoyl synthase n=5 Tax=Pseudoalteromonas TaxID=53246 RepID=LIPA_PSET1|nr:MULTISPECIES: lipoyl synthase [Pseudoalteromonas]Q3IJ81.1 RecName: Full=Lipoyl synthase; AltName: Full=Lip-syn; Short=LS; AltName: Full=Lipoate synthase; AltName: Full=Lipoic acid synthase; AltName: Full=Sulfur insertion protein LipA [Pseudoalteromonas translucida TAC125]MBB1369801.1 lipoyl synthase [Pseudoalteromonas sp. SR45-4]MBB1404045.1 lipoyl synthase [Pseudoalteromonas sp. SG44-5]MBE0420328.1 lipoyl synthase [Pseudoalteromonas nigrifaciens]MBH0070836.1 lipoyl synthase [Pseudoalteromo|tara:strand:+ start:136 stop:1101 length:966 start_codon:yes stop_codon:yes gene_type:complete